MRVVLLVSRAGAGFVQNRGDEIEVEDAEALRMIDAEQAIPVRAARKERAVAAPVVETAAAEAGAVETAGDGAGTAGSGEAV